MIIVIAGCQTQQGLFLLEQRQHLRAVTHLDSQLVLYVDASRIFILFSPNEQRGADCHRPYKIGFSG